MRPANQSAIQSGAMRLRSKQVNVATRSRSKARVKNVIDRHCPANGDVIGQILIAAAHPSNGIARDIGFKMNNLQRGVNARIGATSGDHADRSHRNFRERFFQLLLHGGLSNLPLPAAVGNAAILKSKRPALRKFLCWPGRFC